MTHDPTFRLVLLAWIALALAVFPVLLRVRAPYGRYASRSWGPMIPSRIGWIVMELPAALAFAAFFAAGEQEKTAVTWFFFACWELHYLNRSLVYPFRQRTSGKRMPVVVALMAVVFNCGNGYLNGHYLGALAPVYRFEWLVDPRFALGLALFVGGAAVNAHSDRILLGLRRPGERGYRIPHGGLFRYVSCPNYLGELVEWTGFAVMTWSPAAAVFALWTAANLVPRALAHQRWYRAAFPDYPDERKAIMPFVL